ncbi:hypothetical protein MANES_10G077210v8 [Manihot esculenta]|uniref:Uncharacterized protein n=1 Tax=Manihot esculenta TaxID=3983 RepID=A0ACB7H177_MANES|nr:hypothetical protein MANES_10G077210v8 [Manihot esculenta]
MGLAHMDHSPKWPRHMDQAADSTWPQVHHSLQWTGPRTIKPSAHLPLTAHASTHGLQLQHMGRSRHQLQAQNNATPTRLFTWPDHPHADQSIVGHASPLSRARPAHGPPTQAKLVDRASSHGQWTPSIHAHSRFDAHFAIPSSGSSPHVHLVLMDRASPNHAHEDSNSRLGRTSLTI